MSGTLLFTPSVTLKITTATSSAAVALTGGGQQARLKNNDATDTIFVNFGDSTVTASSTTGMPLGPGDVAGITLPANATHIATIGSANTPILYVTRGNGV